MPSHGKVAGLGTSRLLPVVLCVLVGVAFGLDLVGLGSIAAGLLAGGGMTAVVLAFAFRGIETTGAATRMAPR